jgi:hypothetical protein
LGLAKGIGFWQNKWFWQKKNGFWQKELAFGRKNWFWQKELAFGRKNGFGSSRREVKPLLIDKPFSITPHNKPSTTQSFANDSDGRHPSPPAFGRGHYAPSPRSTKGAVKKKKGINPKIRRARKKRQKRQKHGPPGMVAMIFFFYKIKILSWKSFLEASL